jgi:hypothetical protein
VGGDDLRELPPEGLAGDAPEKFQPKIFCRRGGKCPENYRCSSAQPGEIHTRNDGLKPARFSRCLPENDPRRGQGRFRLPLDVSRLVNRPERFSTNSALLEECRRKHGRGIVSCHARDPDRIPEMNLHFVEFFPGRGRIDDRTWLRALASAPFPVPLMPEHARTADEYAEGGSFLRRTAAEPGLRFAGAAVAGSHQALRADRLIRRRRKR